MSIPVASSGPAKEPTYQDWTEQVDQLPDEFDRLRNEVHSAIRFLERASQSTDNDRAADTRASLNQSRTVLEFVLQDVYERRFGEPHGNRMVDEMLRCLAKEEQLPPLIQADAHYVRNLGNSGSHYRNQQSTLAEGRQAMTHLLRVIDWYAEARRSGLLDLPPVRSRGETTTASNHSSPRLTIVPKGLRSFDSGDARFFVKLLPGPFHSDGLPESIHFWKYRIESQDHTDRDFTVGVIAGPSGCGKSSLVKAGLLPHLDKRVLAAYIEATADGTEVRLLKVLRARFPKLSPEIDLVQAIETLWREDQRRAAGLTKAQKVLIVIDQFEQWLHAHRGEKNTELARALRQCDGERVQAVVMVRDDFLAAATEFMADLGIDLSVGKNALRVELFDLSHARKILAAFGQAYERWIDDPSPEQNAFLDEAVKSLARDHQVVSVRLALFAQMFREKQWTTEALKEVGGAEGVGSTFLEETFFSDKAQRDHRDHRDGAIAVLKALLPEDETDIKGRERSYEDLLLASNYRNRREFDSLLTILDAELRLISPSAHDRPDFTGVNTDETRQADPASFFYQLTHDYLVTSLRKWLDRKLQETRKGRAEKLLESRAGIWKGRKSEDRYLPSIKEHIEIRLLTNRSQWTPGEREMLARAVRVHQRKAVLYVVAAVALGLGTWTLAEARNSEHAREQVHGLLKAEFENIPDIIQDLNRYRRWAVPLLRVEWARNEPDPDEHLKVALALLSFDSDKAITDYVFNRLLVAAPDEFPVIRDELERQHRSTALIERLWNALEKERNVQAARALAKYTADDSSSENAKRWQASANVVSTAMINRIAQDIREYKDVVSSLKPIGRHLIAPLAAVYNDPIRVSSHGLVANVLADYAVDQPERLAEWVAGATSKDAFNTLYSSLTKDGRRPVALAAAELDRTFPRDQVEPAALHRANAAIALMRLDAPGAVWPLLNYTADPRSRSYIIHRARDLGVEPAWLVAHCDDAQDPGTRQALLLALGEFPLDEIPSGAQSSLLEKIGSLYRGADDPGVHGVAEWLLRHWNKLDRLGQSDRKPSTDQRWYVNSQGETMVVVPPSHFKAGAAAFDPADYEGKKDPQRDVAIDYAFSIGAHEVTFAQFRRFREPTLSEHAVKFLKTQEERIADCPVIDVTWFLAAAYCNWLSDQEHLEHCYEPNSKGLFEDGMSIVPQFRKRRGYRLPTEDEWEYACRAGTITPRYYGYAPELLERYVWFDSNAKQTPQPVGSLRPNRLGLFDMLGNALEWCQDSEQQRAAMPQSADDGPVSGSLPRAARGEKFMSKPQNVLVYKRDVRHAAGKQDWIMGFRVARTEAP